MRIVLPCSQRAQDMGWRYHVQWVGQNGLTCFTRRRSAYRALCDVTLAKLEGFKPVVVNVFTGEPEDLL